MWRHTQKPLFTLVSNLSRTAILCKSPELLVYSEPQYLNEFKQIGGGMEINWRMATNICLSLPSLRIMTITSSISCKRAAIDFGVLILTFSIKRCPKQRKGLVLC